MALPRKLKNLNLFNDGASYLGQVTEFTPPTLTRSMEDYRGGGMNGAIKIDNGMEAMECEWKCGGLMRDVLRQFGGDPEYPVVERIRIKTVLRLKPRHSMSDFVNLLSFIL